MLATVLFTDIVDSTSKAAELGAMENAVKDLTGLISEDAGERELKGVPDRWRL